MLREEQQAIVEAIELVCEKDYMTLAHSDVWDRGIHLHLDVDMPFDVSFDEFVYEDKNEVRIHSDDFQREMLTWLTRCLNS